MAQYELTGPDGSTHQVVAPEGMSLEDLVGYVQSQQGGGGISARKVSPNYPDLTGQEINLSGGTLLRSDAQGIPILRNFVPPTAESETYAKAFPKNAAANRVIAGGLATAPLFAAAPELLPSMAVGGAISAADSATHGDDPGQIALSTGLGAVSSAVGRGTGAGTGNLITPHPASAEHQALINTLETEVPGVRLTAGQRTGSEALRYRESERGRAIDYNPDEPLQRSVTNEVMTRIGHNPTLATQPEMDAALQGIGNTFNRVYGRNDLTIDQPAIDEVQNILTRYHSIQDSDKIKGYFGQILANMQSGKVVPGENYGIVRSELAKMQRNTGSGAGDAENASTAGDIKDALDDAYERSIQAKGAYPDALEDLGALRTARSQYRNFLTLEKAAAASNQQANYGYITPESLQGAVKANEGTRAYATGRGDLSELANAYAGVSRRLPNSGTAERFKSQNAERNLALILAGAEGGNVYGQQDENKDDLVSRYGPPIGGALGGYALTRGLNSAQAHMLFNPVMQGYLRNQVMTPWMQSILRALGASTGNATVPQTQPPAQTIVNTLTGTGAK